MSAHTPGPWLVEEWESNAASYVQIRPADRATGERLEDVDDIAEVYRVEDAARIVACVNACEGMDDPAAEIARLRDAAATRMRLQANLDAAFDALAVIRRYHARLSGHYGADMILPTPEELAAFIAADGLLGKAGRLP